MNRKMTKAEREAAIQRAVSAFQSELERNAPAIGAILEGEADDEPICGHRVVIGPNVHTICARPLGHGGGHSR